MQNIVYCIGLFFLFVVLTNLMFLLLTYFANSLVSVFLYLKEYFLAGLARNIVIVTF